MKAITICQPYASLIVQGIKTVENRTWPTPYRGDILIHAGKSVQWIRDFNEECNVDVDLGVDSYLVQARQLLKDYGPLVRGGLIGIARIIDCTPLRSTPPPYRQSPWCNGPWCWLLDNPRILPTPIKYRGQLGVFEVPDSIIEGMLP